jgi:nucleoid-associated protein YgaU
MEGGLTPGTEREKERAADGGLVDSLSRPQGDMPPGRKGKLGSAKKTYTVQPGDTMQKIAQAVYGDGARWKEIFEANRTKISDPNLIQVGQELVIP